MMIMMMVMVSVEWWRLKCIKEGWCCQCRTSEGMIVIAKWEKGVFFLVAGSHIVFLLLPCCPLACEFFFSTLEFDSFVVNFGSGYFT